MAPSQIIDLKPLYTAAQVQEQIDRLVEQIASELRGEELIVIGLLKGCFMFLADIARKMHKNNLSLVIDFMRISAYGSRTESRGKITLEQDITIDIEGRNVLIIDDIIDTGLTMHFVRNHLLKKKPASLKTCVFFDKPARRKIPFQVDYCGLTVPDAFIVGYGLDFNDRFRELPYVSILSVIDKSPNKA